jgi:hypothetical protein
MEHLTQAESISKVSLLFGLFWDAFQHANAVLSLLEMA